jgi:hypothetical protein
MPIAPLLVRRRLAPSFATRFRGTLNENLFRNALLVMVAFHVAEHVERRVPRQPSHSDRAGA